MKKENYQQLELFSQETNQTRPQISGLLLNFIKTWEKTIFIIIGLTITGIASFSLGVEKGKRITQLKIEQTTKTPQSQPIKKEELKEYLANYYTIQVASFINKINAQKEVESIKRKGLSCRVLPKGKFNIVCVGNFSNRQGAELLLPKLKKQYRDCHIRRL